MYYLLQFNIHIYMLFLDKIFLQILSAPICTLSPSNIFPPNYMFSLFLETLINWVNSVLHTRAFMCCIINGVLLEKKLIFFSSNNCELSNAWVKFQGPSHTVADSFANFTFCKSYVCSSRNYELSVPLHCHSWQLPLG